MSKLAVAVLFAGLIGCASFAPHTTQLPPLAPPIAFDEARRTTQTVVITRNEQSYRMLCVLEFGRHGLVLVAFSELGQRLLTIQYGPDRYAIDLSPVVPLQFDAKLVLADLQLVYWPLDVLRKSLRNGWSVAAAESHNARTLVHDGDLVAESAREADGTIDLRRPSLGYQMTITAVAN
jgi:hypothetical protein